MKGPFTVTISHELFSASAGDKPAAVVHHKYANLDLEQLQRIQYHIAVARDAIESGAPIPTKG